MANKIPTISPDRLDHSPIVSKHLGYSKEANKTKAFIKGKEATITTAVRIPQNIYDKLKILKIIDDKSMNVHIVQALKQYVSDPKIASQIKKISRKIKV